MTYFCYVCNGKASLAARCGVNIFNDETTLKSGKGLLELLSDILKKPVVEEGIHTNLICKKCHKAVIEYDCLQVRCQTIQLNLLNQFKRSLSKHNLEYDTYGIQDVKDPVKQVGFQGKKIVLPASKLQPLPPNFVIKPGQYGFGQSMSNLPKLKPISSALTNTKTTNSTSQTKTIVQPNVTTNHSFKEVVIEQADDKESEDKNNLNIESVKDIQVSNSSIPTTSTVLTLNVASLPKDFLSSAVLNKLNKNFEIRTESDHSETDGNDENPMEIDEDCSLAVITSSSSRDKLVFGEYKENGDDDNEEKQQYVSILPEDFVMSKLQILQDQKGTGEDDADEHTIVMDGDNGSILRVMSGQKLMLGDREISLVMPDDVNDNGDSQDSNEDSQIELQVSGDEETANAIIAAAQEQGGAFIKVESGEMYQVQVQSVQSKQHSDSEDDALSLLQMVKQENDLFRCQLCYKNESKETFFEGDATTMMFHLKNEHNARIYICTFCGKLIRKRSDYARHIEEHSSQKSNKSQFTMDKGKVHACTICQKKYSSRNLLTEHMNIHNGSRPYTCGVCEKSFASKYTHQAHMKTHSDRPRPYKCTHCGKSFFTQQNLSQHEKTHSGVKDFVCTICGKAFGSQHNLEVHGVVHSRKRPFACPCGKAFARRAELRDHTRTHTGERPFKCETCGARFTQRSNLHSHRRATHLDDKRYHCDLCPKRFKRRRLLDYHIKASHTGERPLVCEICSATFVYPEHYKKHIRIHSGERPYVCEICGKSFNSRDNRNTHRFVHSDRKPYECLVCGNGFMRKQLLYQHMNSSGHLAESIVVNQPRVTKANQVFDTTAELQLEAAEKSIEMSDGDSPTKFFLSGDKKLILQDGKTIDIQEADESTLLTLHNIGGELKSEETMLEAVAVENMTHAQVTSDGDMMVQIQLPGGDSGWVAINL